MAVDLIPILADAENNHGEHERRNGVKQQKSEEEIQSEEEEETTEQPINTDTEQTEEKRKKEKAKEKEKNEGKTETVQLNTLQKYMKPSSFGTPASQRGRSLSKSRTPPSAAKSENKKAKKANEHAKC
ncbi:protein pxr1-like [Pecten maximus]|uniref:protein pxr1-like n=1 Tax=Pecten maximus TaxID=6579 RepID=UPI001458D008|nr:protein pxr1-like [Pecten maximus]